MLLFSLITHHQADVKREADLRGKISKETSQVASTAQEHEHWRHKVHARTHARRIMQHVHAARGGRGWSWRCVNHLLMRLKVVAQEEEVEKEVHSDIDAPDQKEVCAVCAAGELFVCC